MAASPSHPGLTGHGDRPGGRRRVPWATLLLAAAAVLALWPAAQPSLVFDRTAILHGEIWRLYSGNLTHFGVNHLAWNLAVLLVAGSWVERLRPWRAGGFLLTAPAVIGLALLLFRPGLEFYAGLSGVTTGAVVLLALMQGSEPGIGRWLGVGLLLLVAIKLAAEWVGGGAVFAHFAGTSVRVEPAAHLAGLAWAGIWQAGGVIPRKQPAFELL